MPLESALIAYAGFALLALGTQRLRNTLAPSAPPLKPARARLIGGALLALSFVAAVLRFGSRQGPVAWFGLSSLAALALVLVLSRWPRVALGLLPAAAILLTPLAIWFEAH